MADEQSVISIRLTVIPTQVGVQKTRPVYSAESHFNCVWIPDYSGMTVGHVVTEHERGGSITLRKFTLK